MKLKPSFLILLTFVVALCSIVYEFILAQTFAATLGGTIYRYNITIGFFCASLGMGALWVSKKEISDPVALLIKVEIALALIGAGSVFLVVLLDSFILKAANFFSVSASHLLVTGLLNAIHILFIAGIGFLSGIELPMLMKAGKETSQRVSNTVLVVDYIGTLAGALLFPLVLFPNLGIFFTAIAVGCLNMGAAVLLTRYAAHKSRLQFAGSMTALFALMTLLLFHEKINLFIINTVYY